MYSTSNTVRIKFSVNNDAAIDTLRLYLEREKNNIQLYQFSVADVILLTQTILQNNCFSWKRKFYQQLRGLAMGNRLAPILAILYQFSVADVILLTQTILQNNCFSWKRKFYQQLRGLAMGNRLAPILAILYMDRIENQAIYSDLSLSVSIYSRYIDDCLTPASNPEEATFIQNKLNSQDPAIHFEIELPDKDGFLPFLNTKIKVNESGIVETGWYTKSANKSLTLNKKSNHPEHMKQACISNTIQTYTAICSTDMVYLKSRADVQKMSHTEWV